MSIENLEISEDLWLCDLEELRYRKPELEYLSQFFFANGYSNICDKILKVLDFINGLYEIEQELEFIKYNVFFPACKFKSFDIEKATAERIIDRFENNLEKESKK